MARKHHVKHHRSKSHYPERLNARGESSASVRMPFFDRWGRTHNTMDEAERARPRRSEESEAA